MSTYTNILFQIVFSTKNRERTLIQPDRRKLFNYIWKLMENKKCYLYRIGGVEDHIHIVAEIHPSISISQLVKDIKLSATYLIKSENIFPKFRGWQSGYGAFTYDVSARYNLINYVKYQEEHHKQATFIDEYVKLLRMHKIEFDERYLF